VVILSGIDRHRDNAAKPGVFIILQHLKIGAAIDELLLIWSASDSDEWINRILYLPL
jgi:hypothetical protein